MGPVPYEKDELKASYSQDQTDPEDNHQGGFGYNFKRVM